MINRTWMFKLLEHYIKSITEIDQLSLDIILSKFSLIKTSRNEVLVDYDEVCKNHYFVNKGALGFTP